MKLSALGEFGLVERIRRRTATGKGVRLGIGDDAAWVDCPGKSLLLSTDLLVEGRHFNLCWTSFRALGWKALAVNLSDIAAMGGKPAYFVVSLGVPVDFSAEDVEKFYQGMRAVARRNGVALVGGDTSAADRWLVSIAIVGFAPYGAVPRSGAGVGDDLYVTGTLGDAALGLELLKERLRVPRGAASYLLARHHLPTPRLAEGMLLAREKVPTSMIDVSDGLVQDLGHLCAASGVGAVVWEEALPLSRAYRSLLSSCGTKFALGGGEDYELLFSARARDRNRVARLAASLPTKVSRIGRIVPAREGISVLDRDGRRRSVEQPGYDHFKK
jgi:thiamine-monophosphate kinase